MFGFNHWTRVLTLLITLCGISSLLSPSASAASSTSAFSARQGQETASSTCLQPPQNVNLTTLSDAQLQAYGLPTHQVIDLQPQKWHELLSPGLKRTCGSTPDKRHFTQSLLNSPNAIKCDATPGDMCPNSTWAGNIALGSRGTYREADTEFIVPTIPTSPSDSEVFIWAGVGGDRYVTSTYKLVQVGIDITPNAFGSGQINQPFWKVVPGYTVQDLNMCSIKNGDKIFVQVQSNLNGSGDDYFDVEDESTTPKCYAPYTDTKSSDFSDSATGECIVERNENGFPLANFGTVTFANGVGCSILDNTTNVQAGVGYFPHNYAQIYSDPNNPNSSTLMASVGSITNYGNYSVYWKKGS